MNTIENRAKVSLTHLMTGKFAILNSIERRNLASWLCLKTLIFEYDDRTTMATTQADRDWLYQHKFPPENWCMFVSSQLSLKWYTRLRHYGMGLWGVEDAFKADTENNMQVTTFGFGLAVAQTLSFYGEIPKNIALDYLKSETNSRLWPMTVHDLLWPTLNELDDKGADVFADRLVRGIENIEGRS